MRKKYYIADRETNQMIAAKMLHGSCAMYDAAPELRKGYYTQDLGILSAIVSLPLWALARFTQALLGYALSLTIIGLILIYVGWLMLYRAKKLGVSGDISNTEKCKGIPWLDPYGIARHAVDVPGKKTYFIVDAEKNAVVDVLRLGRWGQKRLNRRAKRTQKIT